MLKPIKNALLRSARFLSTCQPAILLSGGIDSSLYASYLKDAGQDHFKAIYCKFEGNDPEFKFAKMIAERIDTDLHVGKMQKDDAMSVIEDVVSLTDHPFSDFSSLPITFILGFLKAHFPDQTAIIECNGGDDCFGFAALAMQKKFILKNNFPKLLKDLISFLFKNSNYWKWESKLGILARILALSDVHETNLLNYFLVSTPINFLDLNKNKEWDNKLTTIMDDIFSNCGEDYNALGYEARTTIRQLLHINSRKWTAKAFSVGESLGIRVIYPFIWHDILAEQGKLPWNLKVYNGIVKWPLKKLLEEFMSNDFIYRKKSGFVPPFVLWLTSPDFNAKVHDILLSQNGYITRIVPKKILDELLSDALKGRELRSGILYLLWGALFTEMWIQKYKVDQIYF
jgi:asparagine synthase (glutamine-hydrolysing)